MSLWSRLMNALRPSRLIDEVDEEIRDHIARRAEALRAEGLNRAEAERQARRAFGNVASLRDEGRDVRTWMAFAEALRDIRYAVRTLRRHPGVTFTIVSSLGMALGAMASTYLVVNAALLRPLPVSDPHRLTMLAAVEAGGAVRAGETRSLFSVPLFLELRDAARPVASLALFSPANRMEVQITDDPTQPVEMASVQFVSEDAFDVLRVRPAAGRFFGQEDSRPDTGAAVVSWDFWQRRLGGDRAVIDRPLRLAGRVFRVVGVAPRGFFGVEPGVFVDVWRPAATFDPSALNARAFNWSHVLGRLTGSSSRDR